VRRPVRILLLNERCHGNPLSGGAETHLFEVFSRLVDSGAAEVTLLCSGFGGAEPRDEHRGVRIDRLGTRLSYYAKIVGEIRRRLRRGEVDLIVEALNKIPFLTPLYANVPVLAIHHHLHGLTAFRQVSPPLALGSFALEQMVPLVYRRCPILTISHSSKLELVRRGLPEDHIDVVPCGIDHEVHRHRAHRDRPLRAVSLGRLEPYKRIDLAIRAFRRVVDEVPGAHFDVVGRGQEEPRLRQLADRLGLSNHVTFHGFVDEVRKVELLQSSALLVQCSRKEGWGLTVVEAYACGTPVVATAVPGLVDSVQDGLTGVLVQRPRPKVLAAAMTKLLRDESKRAQMADYAVSCAQRFCWDAAARDVRHAISGLLPSTERITLPTPSPAPVLRLGP